MYKSRGSKTTGVLGAAMLVFLAACADNDTATPGITAVSPTPMTGTTQPGTYGANTRVADITGNLNNYLGQTVTVVADVQEVLGPRAFKLDEDSPLAGGIDNDLMVLSPQARNLTALDDNWLNNKVRVTGVVRQFAVADIEREVGWDLDTRIETELSGNKPVLIANSVERVQ